MQFFGRERSIPGAIIALVAIGMSLPGRSAEPPGRLDEAAALRAAGKLDDALEVLRTESREIRQADGEESARVLPVNQLAAEILLDQRQTETAEALINKSMALHESLISSEKASKESLGTTLLVLARLHLIAKRVPAAIEMSSQAVPLLDTLAGPRSQEVARGSEILETAVEALDKLLGPADTMTIDAREKAARVFESLGRFDQAIAQRKGILTGLRARGDKAKDAAAERLSLLMQMAGRAKEALPILEGDPSIAKSFPRLLGELQLADNQLLAAKTSLEAAMAADAMSAKMGTMVNRLCHLLIEVRRDRVHTVPDWFESDIKALSKPITTESLLAVSGLVMASEVLTSLGKPAAPPLEKAVAILRRLQPAAPKMKGRTAPVPALRTGPNVAGPFADVAGRLAVARLTAGDPATAQKEAQAVIPLATDSLGPGDGRVGILRVVAADAFRAAGDLETAASLAGQSLDYGIPRPDDAQEEFMVAVYDRLASAQDQRDWRGEFLAGRARQFGEQHPHVAMAWSLFGASRLAAGDWPTAAECFSRSLDIQRATLGEDHPEVAATLSLMAHAQRAGGDATRSARTAADAVAMWERIVGPNHPGTLEAIDVLVSSRLQAGQKDGVPELLKRLCAAEAVSDPVSRAYHLVRLADLTARKDKIAARNHVQEAMKLPCWASDEGLSVGQHRRLAETAAYAARAYRAMGDEAAGQTTLLKARSMALRLDETGGFLNRIEQLAQPEH